MAPVQPLRPDKEKRVKSILAFARDLESQLPAAASSRTSGNLAQETQKQISSLPSTFVSLASAKCEEIDHVGTAIWNLCTRLRRGFDLDRPQDIPIILLLARVFSFLLLDCANDNGKNTSGCLPRLMKIGIKAAKSCLEGKQLNLALTVLTRVAAYETLFTKSHVASPAQGAEVSESLVAEYYILRTALAWQQNNLGVAEQMYQKSMSSQQLFDSGTAESLADVLYELGKDMLNKQQYSLAIKWLERSYKVLEKQELERLSIDAGELQTSIMQSLIKSLLASKQAEAIERARSLVALLEGVVGDKLIVLLLKLEILSAPTIETFDSESYSDILHRMARSMSLIDANFKLIMFHIRKLNDKSPSLACKALDELLRLRVLKSDEERADYIEKILVTRLWITTSQTGSSDVLKSIDELFSHIASNTTKPISSAATLAAHTLLWKRIESSYSQGQYDVAENWCHLAMHRIFEKAGELNNARISRKLLLCALARKDSGGAREIFTSMSDMAKNEPMTRFLMYKIALRCGETELAAECLQIINVASAKTDPTLLYACCLDAQQVGSKSQVLVVLQLVLEKYSYAAPSTIHFPSLLRLTISLMVELLDDSRKSGANDDEAGVEKLCQTFEGAVISLRKCNGPLQTREPSWTVPELDWFSKNSYNIAIQQLPIWPPRQSLRMLKCCIAFIDQYPDDISEQISEDLCLRKMFCDFSAATALVALARGEDNVEVQLQDYLNLRKHVDSFDRSLQDKLDKVGEDAEQDLLRKLSILIAFDFEAACQLKAWDELGEIVLKSNICRSGHVYEIMADCMLCSQAPTPVLISTMKKIINEAWSLETLDFTKLAKYMRCLFQIAISDNVEIAEELVDQVHSHAEEAAEESYSTDLPYPTEELEWIATKSFNHAVDLYCSGNDNGCRSWAGRALNVAHFCSDGGALEKLLQDKLLNLRFDE